MLDNRGAMLESRGAMLENRTAMLGSRNAIWESRDAMLERKRCNVVTFLQQALSHDYSSAEHPNPNLGSSSVEGVGSYRNKFCAAKRWSEAKFFRDIRRMQGAERHAAIQVARKI